MATDLLYEKKSAFLNLPAFTVVAVGFFALWTWLSAAASEGLVHPGLGRRHQVDPEEPVHVRIRDPARRPLPHLRRDLLAEEPRVPLVLDDVRGLVLRQLHERGALALGVIIMLWLYDRGDFRGILKTDHLWAASAS